MKPLWPIPLAASYPLSLELLLLLILLTREPQQCLLVIHGEEGFQHQSCPVLLELLRVHSSCISSNNSSSSSSRSQWRTVRCQPA
jgi:hypothetical protein